MYTPMFHLKTTWATLPLEEEETIDSKHDALQNWHHCSVSIAGFLLSSIYKLFQHARASQWMFFYFSFCFPWFQMMFEFISEVSMTHLNNNLKH
jgi:hypothetical protein